MFNWKPTGLDANVARTVAAPVQALFGDQHQVFVGDSVTAGWNSLSPTFTSGKIDRDKSWPYYYRRTLTSLLGLPAGGTGLVRSYELNAGTTAFYDKRWTPGPNGVGVQAKGHFIQITNASATFSSAATGFTTITGDTVAVVYIDSDPFTVSVDGKAKISVPGGRTGTVKRWELGGLPLAKHTVKIAAPSGKVAKIVGAEVFQRRGVSAHNVAEGGTRVTGNTADDWSWGGTPTTSMAQAFSSSNAYARTPSTVFICLGGNDLNKSTASAIRDGIRETAAFYEGSSEIVLIAQCHGSQSFSKVDIKPLLGLLYQVAAEKNWPLWDLEHFLGGYEKLAAAKLTGDTWGHLNPAGHELMGRTMAQVVARSLG